MVKLNCYKSQFGLEELKTYCCQSFQTVRAIQLNSKNMNKYVWEVPQFDFCNYLGLLSTPKRSLSQHDSVRAGWCNKVTHKPRDANAADAAPRPTPPTHSPHSQKVTDGTEMLDCYCASLLGDGVCVCACVRVCDHGSVGCGSQPTQGHRHC